MHRPVALEAGDPEREVAQQLGAVGRVHDLGVELHAVVMAALVGDRREGRVLAGRDDLEAGRQLGDPVAVAHPDLLAVARLPDPVEQGRCLADLELGAAEFAVVTGFDAAAELLGHGLFAVADAQHRHLGLENGVVGGRRLPLDHRGRPAGQDDGPRIEALQLRPVDGLEGMDLAVNACFTQAAGDQLGDLGPEINDQQTVGHGGIYGTRAGRSTGAHVDCHPRLTACGRPRSASCRAAAPGRSRWSCRSGPPSGLGPPDRRPRRPRPSGRERRE